MNDNDLIRRGDVLSAFETEFNGEGEECYWFDGCREEVVEVVKAVPAVPQEMSAVELLNEEARICDSYKPTGRCSDCPIYKWCLDGGEGQDIDVYSDEYVAIVERWAREHPEERSEKW